VATGAEGRAAARSPSAAMIGRPATESSRGSGSTIPSNTSNDPERAHWAQLVPQQEIVTGSRPRLTIFSPDCDLARVGFSTELARLWVSRPHPHSAPQFQHSPAPMIAQILLAALTLTPGLALGQVVSAGPGGHHAPRGGAAAVAGSSNTGTGTHGAPEIDANLGRAGLVVLAGGALILLSRRRRRAAVDSSSR
jgi:hypothetical protein